jgi:hypothetical protein
VFGVGFLGVEDGFDETQPQQGQFVVDRFDVLLEVAVVSEPLGVPDA